MITSGTENNKKFLEDVGVGITEGKPQASIYPELPKEQRGTLKQYLYNPNGSPVLQDKFKTEKEFLPGERLVTVYFPPGYDPQRKPPYHLQIGLDGHDLPTIGTNVTLDNLIAEKKIEPVVAIFIPPWNGSPQDLSKLIPQDAPPGYRTSMRIFQYNRNQETAEQLANIPQQLRQELKLNVTLDPKATVITGVSISGQQAIYTALMYPSIFGSVISQSPAVGLSAAVGPLL